MLRHLALVCALTLAPLAANAGEVTVFAAASLGTALTEVATLWVEGTGHQAIIVPAGSATLARQIQQGAPADVFISANTTWMDVLDRGGQIQAGSRRDLVTNRLVLIGHGNPPLLDLRAPDTLRDRLGSGRLAMAQVDAVPAGIYGKAALQSLGHWGAVADRVAQTDNVRAALALVAAGAAPLGIVYATDARSQARVTVLAVFPTDSHAPIVYPAAQTSDSTQAVAFLDFLMTPAAQRIFAAHGFGQPGPVP